MKLLSLPLLKKRRIDKLIKAGFPSTLKPALEFLAFGKTDEGAATVSAKAEARRAELAAEGGREVAIWYSPKPGSSGDDASPEARPQPGNVLKFTMEKIARTGKDKRWGTALYLVVRESRAASAVELGSCAGISAMYLAAPETMRELVTVEGSAALAEIAAASLKDYANAKVVNSLFDDAIDNALGVPQRKLDLAYIDGHHEKVATIHYFNRLLPYLAPGAVVIFDDISWSADMWEGWEALCARKEFAHAADFGTIGVCLMKKSGDDPSASPKLWDLQHILGKHGIGNPEGWKQD